MHRKCLNQEIPGADVDALDGETYWRAMFDSLVAAFGDVHSNLEALEAVLADMESLGIRRRFCLGDIVGYAANPSRCLETVRSLRCPVLKGNHDAFAASDSTMNEMRDVAQIGIEFSRQKLTSEQRKYLFGLPLEICEEDCQFVHASLNTPAQWLYVAGEVNARDHFNAQTHSVCFCGHTHVPRVWHHSDSGEIRVWRGKGRIQLPDGGKTLINAGSVGQPRDLCPDACYAVFDSNARQVEFRRVGYDFRKTKLKIVRAKLPKFTAQRLSLGR
jgi:diadenosine tetraphosphatase ApaH/serine/threonine PP2A family protein phosphatase